MPRAWAWPADGAGGNLAAAAAIGCRDAGIRLAAQLLVYPVVDLAGAFGHDEANSAYPSRTENANGYFLTLDVMRWFADHYLPVASRPTRGRRRCAPPAWPGWRRPSSAAPGSTRCATKASPMPARCALQASRCASIAAKG